MVVAHLSWRWHVVPLINMYSHKIAPFFYFRRKKQRMISNDLHAQAWNGPHLFLRGQVLLIRIKSNLSVDKISHAH